MSTALTFALSDIAVLSHAIQCCEQASVVLLLFYKFTVYAKILCILILYLKNKGNEKR